VTALWAAVQKRKAGHNSKRLIMGFSGLNGLPIMGCYEKITCIRMFLFLGNTLIVIFISNYVRC